MLAGIELVCVIWLFGALVTYWLERTDLLVLLGFIFEVFSKNIFEKVICWRFFEDTD